jgi:hypothetical protein
MDKFFKLFLNPTAQPGTPGYSLVDEVGDTPNAAALASLAEQLAWLASDAKDREDAASLEPGKYYWYRSKRGVNHVQFLGLDAKGPRIVHTDKDGNPIDFGYGVNVECYYQGYPVACLTLSRHQPVVVAIPA